MKTLKLLYVVILILVTTSCVQQAQPKTIIVKVDMNAIENASEVGLRGANPLSWNETTFLNDNNKDGIYEGSFEIYTASYDVEFKFVTNDSVFELQDQNNRSLTFEYKPETITYEAVFNDQKAKITRK